MMIISMIAKHDYCFSCDQDNQLFEYRRDVLCIQCSLDTAEWIMKRETDTAGNLSRRGLKLAKRRLHLRELLELNRIPLSDKLERENVICQVCGKQFVALVENHLKFCGDCTHFKDQMADLRLRHEKYIDDSPA